MRKIYILAIVLGIHLFSISCSTDTNNPVDQPILEETLLNVPYGSNEQQKYDLYLPAGRDRDKTKVILLVHGGGWTDGDKSDMDYIIPLIKAQHPKHAIVNINYVLADSITPAFPNQFLDIGSAIQKINTEKDDLQLLPEFALIGTSAGAHISLMYAYQYDVERQIKFVADIVGPTDFTDVFYTSNPGFEQLMYALTDESAYPPNTDLAKALSPVYHVSDQTCPSLLFYGQEDPLVPLSNGESLSNTLSDAGIAHNFSIYDGGHGNWSQANYNNMIEQIGNYIETYLKVSD